MHLLSGYYRQTIAIDAHADNRLRKYTLKSCSKKETDKLRVDVAETPKKCFMFDPFDLKQSNGGLIEVGFIVQYLVLVHVNLLLALTGNISNFALLAFWVKLTLLTFNQYSFK